jgi:hypothetical protein
MPDFSLVPVDHQPDFSDVSLVPVDHDPFGADGATQQAQIQPAQPENPPQPPATGVGQPGVGPPAPGDGPGGLRGGVGFGPSGGDAGGDSNPASDQGGSSEPAPFGGYANPTPTESLVNQAKMKDQVELIKADPKNGRFIDGGDLYKFATTKPPIAHYLIDGNTGTVFTTIDPFYANQGSRYAIIDASPERPVTVTVREDGTFTINRP